MKTKIVAIFAFLTYSFVGFSQGTFQDLDFEQANPVGVGNAYPTTSCFPGWQVFYGTTPISVVGLDLFSLGATTVSLITPPHAIDGNYSVDLEGGAVQNGSVLAAATIAQTGLIPAGTQSLLFKAVPGPGPFDVDIGDQSIPFIAVGNGPNYTVTYAANISAWAGQVEQLSFSAIPDGLGVNPWNIDDISFSPTAVPEPSPFALTGMGGLLFALYRGFKPKR
jgi:hypothetical protein